MGGGATITRAAARVTGIGAVRGGLRGYHPTTVLPKEHSVGSGRYAPAGISLSQAADAPVAAAQKSAPTWDWEVDDWEFADYQGGSVPSAAEPMARVVFGGAPSYQEAEAAAAELKDAVEKVYLSPNPFASLVDSLSEEELETKSVVSTKSFDVSSAPKNAVQAFELLSQNSAVQSIVASIASDPNVWNAVMQNEAFMEYLRSQTAPKIPIGTDPEESESESESESEGGWRSPTYGGLFLSDNKTFADFEDNLKNMFQNIKLSVTEMVTTVADYLNNFFGMEKSEPDSRIPRSMSLPDRTVGAYVMGLAVLVVIVVLLRRV